MELPESTELSDNHTASDKIAHLQVFPGFPPTKALDVAPNPASAVLAAASLISESSKQQISIEIPLAKKKYCRISNVQRRELIESLENKDEKLRDVAERLQINYSSAKSILRVFKKEGRSSKKPARNRYTSQSKQGTSVPRNDVSLNDTSGQTTKTKHSTANSFPQGQDQGTKDKTRTLRSQIGKRTQPEDFVDIVLTKNRLVSPDEDEALKIYSQRIEQQKTHNSINQEDWMSFDRENTAMSPHVLNLQLGSLNSQQNFSSVQNATVQNNMLMLPSQPYPTFYPQNFQQQQQQTTFLTSNQTSPSINHNSYIDVNRTSWFPNEIAQNQNYTPFVPINQSQFYTIQGNSLMGGYNTMQLPTYPYMQPMLVMMPINTNTQSIGPNQPFMVINNQGLTQNNQITSAQSFLGDNGIQNKP